MDESSLQWVLARTPTVHWGRHDGRPVGGPITCPKGRSVTQCRTAKTRQQTALPTNMVAEHVTTNNTRDKDKPTNQLEQNKVEVPQEQIERDDTNDPALNRSSICQ